MAFGSFFKPKGLVILQSPDNVTAGQQVSVDITITPDEEIKPREVRAELIGEETYYKTEHHSDASGHSKTHTVEKNEPFASIVKVLAEQPVLSKGMEQKWSCSLQLPPDAACSCRGKLVNIRWKLKAVVDVPNRADLSQEKILNVFSQSHQVSAISTIMPAEKSFDQVSLVLKATPSAGKGGTLKGQLSLQMKEKLNIRSIRIELVQAEVAGSSTNEKVVATAQVAGDTNYSPYDAPSYEFSLNVPADIPPTSSGKHSGLSWKVRAVLDRKMKTDFNVEQEVYIAGPLSR